MFLRITGRLSAPVFAPEGVSDGGGGTEHPVVDAPWSAAQDAPWKIGEGDKATEWWNTIPEGPVREHVKAKAYANPAQLAMGNYNLTKLHTGAPDVLAIPGADAKPEEIAAFQMKLGRPENVEGYKDLKFGDNADERMTKFAKELFFDMGLSPKAAQAATDKWNTFVAEVAASELAKTQETNTKDMAALETRWGQDLSANRAAGERVIKALGLSEDLVNKVENSIGTAAVVELLAMIGRKSDEGRLVGGANNGNPDDPTNMSKEQAAAKITQLQGDTEFQKKYTDAKHPGHAEAVELMQKLFQRT